MKKLFSAALCLLLFVVLLVPAASAATDTDYLDYYIMNYDVEVVATSDRSYHVTERLSVWFNVESRGIYREIPLESSVERVGLSNIHVEGAPYTIEGENFIRIGDPDVYLTGQKDYVISYTLTHYADPEPDYDYLYINLMAGDSPLVQNFSATVELPAGARVNDYTITAGSYGSTGNGASYATSELRGDTIYITGISEFTEGEGLTLNVEMNEGAFADAVPWQPAVVIHNLDMSIDVDEYGLFTVRETFTATVNTLDSGNTYYRELTSNTGFRDYRESVVENLVVTDPDGSVRERSGSSANSSYVVDIADYVGQTITFGAEYTIRYDIRAGTNGEGLLGLRVLGRSHEDIAIENIDVTVNAPFALADVGAWFQNTSSYNYYPEDGSSVAGEVSVNGTSATIHLGKTDELPNPILYYGAMASITFDRSAHFARAPRGADTFMPVFSGILLLIVGLFTFLTKQRPLTPAVEFYPPQGMNPADMGYIIDSKIDGRDATSLIYYWASQGHLSIEMTSKSQFTLHRLKELEGDHATYEHRMFQALWAKGDGASVTSSWLNNSFYTTVNDTVSGVKQSFTGERKMYKSGWLAGLLGVLTPIAFFIAAMAVAATYRFGAVASAGSAFGVMVGAFGLFGASWSIAKSRHKGKSAPGIAWLVVFGIFSVIMLVLFVRGIGGRALSIPAAVISALLVYAAALAAPYVRKRTDFGTSALNYAVGFKQFLQTAEKSRLEMLLEENPDYYYDILPYAQVLGVSTIWQKKFDGLLTQPPTWYYGTGVDVTRINYTLMRSMSTLANSMTSRPAPTPSTGGGFGGGGGFSGGGGGSFSGGGFSGGGSGGGSIGRW